MRMTSPLLAALDIGGTKIAGGLVAADGALVHRVELPTPARGSAAEVLHAVHSVLDRLAEHPRGRQFDALGIGCAGPVDIAAGTVSPVNIPAWRAFPLVAQVTEQLAARPSATGRRPGGVPVSLGGDAVAMTAAEHWLGAARGSRNALCLVVSTGVGAGLVLNGAVHAGPTGNAGHLGHICVDLDGEPCPCGSRGCVEGLASGPAIARHALRHGWTPTGPDRSAAAVAASARDGDPTALAAYDRAAQALAAGIAATATLLEIDTAVVGGGVSRAGDVLFAPLAAHLSRYAALPFAAVRAVPAALGTDAGLIGAAALALTDLSRPEERNGRRLGTAGRTDRDRERR